jgi:hypothetical protein
MNLATMRKSSLRPFQTEAVSFSLEKSEQKNGKKYGRSRSAVQPFLCFPAHFIPRLKPDYSPIKPRRDEHFFEQKVSKNAAFFLWFSPLVSPAFSWDCPETR